MTTATLERPTITHIEPTVVTQAIAVVQEHLDNEARNRRQSVLQPKDLCPMQKAELVQDLVNLFG